jgi:hypothetical protein
LKELERYTQICSCAEEEDIAGRELQAAKNAFTTIYKLCLQLMTQKQLYGQKEQTITSNTS